MDIIILGIGCENSRKLQQHSIKALNLSGIYGNVNLVNDPSQILSYGEVRLPALVINNKVRSQGRVLTTLEIMDMLKG